MTDIIKKVCTKCNGTGTDPGIPGMGGAEEKPCENCVDGLRTVGFNVLPINVFDSYIVLEELDATEHNALTDTQKDGVSHLLMCGRVDLNAGKKGKVHLWSWFGAESTTVTNLTALLE